jgi:hypothetical protein
MRNYFKSTESAEKLSKKCLLAATVTKVMLLFD